jgi:hypothetical protein
VHAYQSTRAAVPMVVGWLRPVVLVPTAALTGLSTAQLRAVLAHELAHIKRHDAVVNLLQSVFESLFFFHPAVWWLSNRLRVEREFCCDDIAVATCGDPLTYAKALAALDDARSARPAAVLAATGGSLMQRITRLLDAGRTTRRARGWIAPMIMTITLTSVVSAMSLTVDEEPDAATTLKGVDLVKVVAPVDGELSEILGILRAGGMDDAMLLDFVTRLGTSPQVLDAIQGATEHAARYEKHRAIEAELSKAHGEIKADVADGLITKDEAKLRIEALHRWMKEMSAEVGLPSGIGLPSGNELRAHTLRKVKEAHAAVSLKGHLVRLHQVEKIEHLKHKLRYLHEELEAGVKTAEEVHPAMDKIKKHIHELMQRHEAPVLPGNVQFGVSGHDGNVLIEEHPDHDAHLDHGGRLHLSHDVHFGPGEEGETNLEPGTYNLRLRESDEAPGVWVTEPVIDLAPETEVVGGWVTESVVELSPIRGEVVDLFEVAEPHEGEWKVVPTRTNVRLSTHLPELTIDSLHDHLRSTAGEVEPVNQRMVQVFSVLTTMRAVPERFLELHVEPVNRVVEVQLNGLVEVPVERIEEVEPIEEIEIEDT